MRAFFRAYLLSIVSILAVNQVLAQQPAPAADPNITPNGVIAEVKAIDGAAKQLIVKTDAGTLVTVSVADNTTYKKLPPGETTLDKATDTAFSAIVEGDRVFARGKTAEDRKSLVARAVIVMSKADLAKKQEEERAEWRRRGVLGVITALNPTAREITISSRSMAGNQAIVIPVAETVEMKRYAPDSIKFADAKTSSFGELQVGDQLRALGEKSADGARFTPEKIVTGSFRTVGGTVSAVDPATGEVKINDLQTKQPLTIVVKQDAVLRRFPPMGEGGMMMMGGPRGGGEGGGPGGNRAQGGGAGQGGPGQGPGQGQGQGQGQGGPRGFNIQEMLERLPTITVADLKVGDTIIVSSTKGADVTRLTAITLVSGADTILNMMAARQQQAGGSSAPNPAGLGQGFQIGIGLP